MLLLLLLLLLPPLSLDEEDEDDVGLERSLTFLSELDCNDGLFDILMTPLLSAPSLIMVCCTCLLVGDYQK